METANSLVERQESNRARANASAANPTFIADVAASNRAGRCCRSKQVEASANSAKAQCVDHALAPTGCRDNVCDGSHLAHGSRHGSCAAVKATDAQSGPAEVYGGSVMSLG